MRHYTHQAYELIRKASQQSELPFRDTGTVRSSYASGRPSLPPQTPRKVSAPAKVVQTRLPLKFHRQDDPTKMSKEQWEQPELHERASHLGQGESRRTNWGTVHRGFDWDNPADGNKRFVKELMNADRMRPTEANKSNRKVEKYAKIIREAHDAGHHWPPGMPYVKVGTRYEAADGKVHHDIADGHHRHLAAIKAGLKEFPVLRQLNPEHGPGSHRGWVEHRLKMGKKVVKRILDQHPGVENVKHDPEYAKRHKQGPYGEPANKWSPTRGPLPITGITGYEGATQGPFADGKGAASTRTLAHSGGPIHQRGGEDPHRQDEHGQSLGHGGDLNVEDLPMPKPPSHYTTKQAPGGAPTQKTRGTYHQPPPDPNTPQRHMRLPWESPGPHPMLFYKPENWTPKKGS